MRIALETRTAHGAQEHSAVLLATTEHESQILDQVFGDHVADDGLIGTLAVERRLDDGCGNDYLVIVSSRPYTPLPGEPTITVTVEHYESMNTRLAAMQREIDGLRSRLGILVDQPDPISKPMQPK